MGVGFALILPVALLCLLVSAGIEDVRRREIANWKNAAIALLAPVWWWVIGLSVWPGMAIQLGLGFAVFALFVLLFAVRMMGGGDVKMIGALALWVPADAVMAMLLLMSIIGGVIAAIMMIDRKWRRDPAPPEVPYGVAIACAALLTFHEPLLNHFR
ncbi:A24 family peptidase [Sphingomonas sp. Y38-1Y]|uniref:A24 family peptidase n=1 Tax=Sphingomonas sp. Y38-1Y TaxID=3078265 RepID=UPI0028ECDFDC|nr:prepilin peptidase [Sphingomonas sp. Y38-1Y]